MEKIERWLWRKKLELYFFFKRLIRELHLEYDARKHCPNDKMARKHYKIWRRNRRKYSECTPEEQILWDEEERLKWKDYYDNLL